MLAQEHWENTSAGTENENVKFLVKISILNLSTKLISCEAKTSNHGMMTLVG